MIVTREDRAKAYLERGIFGTQTLDAIAARLAAGAPDAEAIADIDGDGRITLRTRATAAAEVEALAALFVTVGLKADMVVGLLMPNCASAYVTALAAWRAGLVVVPLPLSWSEGELARAVEALGMRAIVTVGHHDGLALGEIARAAAADSFAVRFLFGFGDRLPDGVMPLDDVIADPALMGTAEPLKRQGNAADHVALIGWARAGDGSPVPVPWSHNNLIAAALAHRLEAGIESGGRLFSAFDPAGLPAFAGALATALMAEASLALHPATTLAGLVRALEASKADHALLPAALAVPLMEATAARPALSLATRDLAAAALDDLPSGIAITDLHLSDGVALIAERRDDEAQRPGALKPGALTVPTWMEHGTGRGLAMAEFRLDPRDPMRDALPGRPRRVHVRGPMVPDAPWPGSEASGNLLQAATRDGFVACSWLANEPAAGQAHFAVPPTADGVLTVGFHTITLAELSRVYAGLPGTRGAVPIMVPHDILGSRLGVSVMLDASVEIDRDSWTRYFDQIDWPEDLRPKVVKSVRVLPPETASGLPAARERDRMSDSSRQAAAAYAQAGGARGQANGNLAQAREAGRSRWQS